MVLRRQTLNKLAATVAIPVVAALGGSACSSESSGNSNPDWNVAPTEPVTEAVPDPESAPELLNASNGVLLAGFTDEQGYQFELSAEVLGVSESIENAPPGKKELFFDGYARKKNVTPGRAAPADSSVGTRLNVVFSIPSGTCQGLTEKTTLICVAAAGSDLAQVAQNPGCQGGINVEGAQYQVEDIGPGDFAEYDPFPTALDACQVLVPENMPIDKYYFTFMRYGSELSPDPGWIASDGSSPPPELSQLPYT
jgi:hypothetical protein